MSVIWRGCSNDRRFLSRRCVARLPAVTARSVALPYFATFSIVARDAENGRLGVAIASGVPAVGAFCVFARDGIGAVATQAWSNPALGPLLLDRMSRGNDAQAALDAAMARDPGAVYRQVGVVDAAGNAAAYSGPETEPWSGHLTGPDLSVQGNMLIGPKVVETMAENFAGSAGRVFAERLLAALEAGRAAGGDRRGLQSAALYIAGPESYGLVDLRVDESDQPIAELERVYRVACERLLPSIAAMPSRANPVGDIATLRRLLAPKD